MKTVSQKTRRGGQRVRRIKLKEIIVGGVGNWTKESKRTAFFSVVRGGELDTKCYGIYKGTEFKN